MSEISGNCLCGAIHYQSISQHPIKMIAGDASDDWLPAEAAVFGMVGIPTDSLRIKGLAPSVFEYSALGGDVALRSFCPQCGTTLFAEFESEPAMIYVRTITSRHLLATDDRWFNSAGILPRQQPGAGHNPGSNVPKLQLVSAS